jgi:hypothetical protein
MSIIGLNGTVEKENRWWVPIQIIPGMRLGTLMRVLKRNRFRVDRKCLGRLGYLILMGALNSILSRYEKPCYRSRIEEADIEKPPLFILGHMRSGTTHLHHLMGQDENFDFPSTYQAIFPHHCYYSQEDGGRIFDWLVPNRRPMDNMALRASTPHEDEFAVAALCGISPYIRVLFPMTEDASHTALDPQLLQPDALESWKDAMTCYIEKLRLGKHPKRILLKSPPHMGRIPMLLKLFPDAQFIHIVRNPYDVYLSTRHLWMSTFTHSHLQMPDWETIDEIILSWYAELFFLFERDRHLIPAGSLHELKYEDLERDPLQSLETIYDRLRLPGFDRFRIRTSQYLETIKGYKKNKFQMDDADREKVRMRWYATFDRYGYLL